MFILVIETLMHSLILYNYYRDSLKRILKKIVSHCLKWNFLNNIYSMEFLENKVVLDFIKCGKFRLFYLSKLKLPFPLDSVYQYR